MSVLILNLNKIFLQHMGIYFTSDDDYNRNTKCSDILKDNKVKMMESLKSYGVMIEPIPHYNDLFCKISKNDFSGMKFYKIKPHSFDIRMVCFEDMTHYSVDSLTHEYCQSTIKFHSDKVNLSILLFVKLKMLSTPLRRYFISAISFIYFLRLYLFNDVAHYNRPFAPCNYMDAWKTYYLPNTLKLVYQFNRKLWS